MTRFFKDLIKIRKFKNMSHSPFNIHNRVYQFLMPGLERSFGLILFDKNGKIYNYHHDNEVYWEITNNSTFIIKNKDKKISSIYEIDEKSGFIYGHIYNQKTPLCLIPIINLEDLNHNIEGKNILINSIPKAGTYFLESFFSNIGYISSNLHLGVNFLHDNRGIIDTNSFKLHYDSWKRVIHCPADLIIQATPKSKNIIVGHIDKKFENYISQNNNISIFPLVRNIRDCLISLFNFKYIFVKFDNHPTEKLIIKSDRDKQFLLFLIEEREDFEALIRVGNFILENHTYEEIIRYEDLKNGIINEFNINKIQDLTDFNYDYINKALISSIGKKTSTYALHSRSKIWHNYWSDAIEVYFKEIGLYDLNKELGYEFQENTWKQSGKVKIERRI